YLPADSAPWWLLNSAAIREFPGTVVDGSNPSALVMSFDLTNAQPGKYALSGVRNSVCGSPASVPNVFQVLMPPEGPNLLTNGDTVEQIIPAPNGAGHYELILTFWVREYDVRAPGCSVKATISADDGTKSSTVIAELKDPLMTVDGVDPYTKLVVDFSGDI